MRRLVLVISCAAVGLASCYGPVKDQSRITAAEILPGGAVGVAYHRYRYRPAAGLAAYPDGGIPKTLLDRFAIGVLHSDGSFQRLADIPSQTLPGAGSVSLRWFPQDPQHLYVSRAGQQTTSLPLRELSQQVRYPLNGGRAQQFSLRAELERSGRKLGAEGFGDFTAIASDGTLLVGATIGGRKELWVRGASGDMRRMATFDRFDGVYPNYLFYSNDGPPFTTYALDRRTWQARPVLRYNRQNTQQEWQAREDPAFRQLNEASGMATPDQAVIGQDGQTIRYVRNGHELWTARVPH
jgi:hypothetical protein